MTEQWINQLQPASFRNIPFQVDSLTTTQGEDVVVREYPFQDLPTIHVMGEGSEEFSLQAYVIGSDYIAKRDQLANILRGKGILVHPTRGHIRCHVRGQFTITENPVSEGGIARFDITFIRADARRYPLAKASHTSRVVDAVVIAETSAKQTFTRSFKTSGIDDPSYQNAVKDSRSVLETITDTFDKFHADLDEIGQYQRDARSVFVKLINLVNEPKDLADHIAKLFKLPLIHPDHSLICGLKAVFNSDLKMPQASFNVQQQASNTAALNIFRQSMALIHASKVLTQIDSLNFFEAKDYLTWYRDSFTQLIEQPNEWQNVNQLQNLKTEVIEFLLSSPDIINKVSEFIPEETQSTLAISYRIYGTVDYADEIKANNPHIIHPFLVPANQALRLLAHG